MLILIVGIAPAEAVVLHLAATPSKRKKSRLTPHPLITTPQLDPRRFALATEATRLAGNQLGFHSVEPQGLSGCVDMERLSLALDRQVHGTADRSILPDHVPLNPIPTHPVACRHGGLSESVRHESIV